METQNNQSDGKTSKSFLGTLMTHNTTIIAIILSIGAMISNHYEQMEQNAYADSQEIQDERSDNDDKLAEAANKVEEYTMQEDADSTSNVFAGLISEFAAQKDSLDKQEEVLQTKEENIDATLEKVKQQNNRSDTARTIFEISILFSSIGMTNKRKLLTYIAISLTAIGIIIILSILLL